MHENIKYTVKLDERIKPLRSQDDLTSGNADRDSIGDWQCLFADTTYGTHYLVYTKFIGKKIGDSFLINNIQLFLQNYTGAVTIGFCGNARIFPAPLTGNDPDIDERYPNRKKYKLVLPLQGFNHSNYCDVTDNVGIKLEHGDILETIPLFIRIDPNLTLYGKNLDEMKKSRYVDPLFMERVGSDVILKSDNSLLYDKIIEKGFDSLTDDEVMEIKHSSNKILGVLFPCKPRNSIFYY